MSESLEFDGFLNESFGACWAFHRPNYIFSNAGQTVCLNVFWEKTLNL